MAESFETVRREHEATPEARLWQAVIATTIQEWVSGPLGNSRKAEEYLLNDNSDFRLVCQSAGMDPVYLRSRLEKLRRQSANRRDLPIAA